MTINFYLNDTIETQINTMSNITIAPYEVNDRIYLRVYDRIHKDNPKYILDNQSKLKDRFNNVQIQIISKHNWMEFNILEEGKMIVDYYCEIIED